MRLTEPLLKDFKKIYVDMRLPRRKAPAYPMTPQEMEKVRFVELFKLELENSIPTKKAARSADVSCLQEMAVMFACMKENDFKEVKCEEQINTFNKCYVAYQEKKKAEKLRDKSGEIVPGSNPRDFTPNQINMILKKFPQYNEES